MFAVCTFDIKDFSSFADNRIELSVNKQNKMDWLVSRNCSFNLIGFGRKSYLDFRETGPI